MAAPCPVCGKVHRTKHTARWCRQDACYSHNHFIIRFLGLEIPEDMREKVERAKQVRDEFCRYYDGLPE